MDTSRTPPQEAALRRCARIGSAVGLGAAGVALERRGLLTHKRAYPDKPRYGPAPPAYTTYTLTPAGQAVVDALLAADRVKLEAERTALGTVVVPVWALSTVIPPQEYDGRQAEAWTALRIALGQ